MTKTKAIKQSIEDNQIVKCGKNSYELHCYDYDKKGWEIIPAGDFFAAKHKLKSIRLENVLELLNSNIDYLPILEGSLKYLVNYYL